MLAVLAPACCCVLLGCCPTWHWSHLQACCQVLTEMAAVAREQVVIGPYRQQDNMPHSVAPRREANSHPAAKLARMVHWSLKC